MQSTINQRIDYLMKELNISAGELAKRVNVTPAAIYLYITNQREPKTSILSTIVSEFGINPEWLLVGTGDMIKGSGSGTTEGPNIEEQLRIENTQLRMKLMVYEELKKELGTIFKSVESVKSFLQ